MGIETGSLFDPSRLEVPAREELIASSPWVAGIAGLAETSRGWMTELPPQHPRLLSRARRLSRPSLDTSTVASLARVAGNVALLALVEVVEELVVPGTTSAASQKGTAERLEQLVRAGGPAWVKLGQFVATAGGLLPEEWVDTFSWCRDEVPPLARHIPRRVVRRAFGVSPRELFADFDDEPLGAASIAQVHRAVLLDGTEVVVKIRRPGLHRRFTSDIRAMAAAAWAAEKIYPVARAGNPSGFVELFAQLVLEELDFRIEALNMVELGVAAEHAGADYVSFPRPIPELVTSRVLVMEKLPGVSYTAAEVDPQTGDDLLRFAIQGVLEHTLIYGVFHGDLHAGNVLLDSSTGRLSLVDFGIVGRLDEAQRKALGRFLVAFAHMDVRAQLDAMVDFGAIATDVDLDVLVAEIHREVRPDDLAEDADVSELANRIGILVRVIARHGVQLPKELVLFFKNLLYLNGFAGSVAPEANLLGQIAPVLAYFAQKYGDAIDLTELVGSPPDDAT